MRIGIIGTSAIAGHFVEGARLAGGIDIAAVSGGLNWEKPPIRIFLRGS